MPKITNSTQADIYWTANTLSIPANSVITTDLYPQGYPPAGITVDPTVAVYDPIIASAKLTGSIMYTLPKTTTPYSIKIYCATGDAQVQINNTGNIIYFGAGMEMNFTCRERVINSLVIASGTVYVVVTKN